MYKLSAVCMHLSKMEFTGHGDVTTAKGVDAGQTMIDICGYNDAPDELYDRFCNPKIKVKRHTFKKGFGIIFGFF